MSTNSINSLSSSYLQSMLNSALQDEPDRSRANRPNGWQHERSESTHSTSIGLHFGIQDQSAPEPSGSGASDQVRPPRRVAITITIIIIQTLSSAGIEGGSNA